MAVLGGLGTRRFEQLLYFDDVAFTQNHRTKGGPSGSMVADGLYVADDSSDPTSGAMNSSGSLVTGSITTGAVTNGTTNWSIGIDQGQAYNVSMISLIDTGTAGAGLSWSGSNDSLTLYESADNSSWDYIAYYQPLARTYASGSAMSINMLCDTTKRYLKLYADSGPLLSAEGNIPYFSGIRTYQSSPTVKASGSYSNVTSAVIDSGQGQQKDIITSYYPPTDTGGGTSRNVG